MTLARISVPVAAAFAILCPLPASTQTMGSSGTRLLSYMWSNNPISGMWQGDTLKVRFGTVNGMDSTVVIEWRGCELQPITQLRLISVQSRCSEAKNALAPGDSIWAEKSWVIDSPQGKYMLQIHWGGGGFGTGININSPDSTTHRSIPPSPMRHRRLPVLLEFSNASAVPVTRDDVASIVRLSAGDLLIDADPRAAANMAATNPYLHLTISITRPSDYRLAGCWIGAEGRRLAGNCEGATTGRAESAAVLGATLHLFIQRQLASRQDLRF
jgi:hypothetical protein